MEQRPSPTVPGASRAHDLAIEREKQRHAAGAAAGTPPKKEKYKVTPREETPRVKAVHKVEDRIRKQNFESAAIVDDDGNELVFKDGSYSEVRFSPMECRMMQNSTLTHNHPRCSMFSPEDLNCMAANQLYEIRATNRDGTTYSMKRAAGGYSTQKAMDFVTAYKNEYPNATRFAQADLDSRGFNKKIWNGEISHQEANIEFGRSSAKYMIDYCEKNASKYGLEFSVEHIESVAQKSARVLLMKSSEGKDDIVLDKETNDMMDAAFNEWLERSRPKDEKTAKSFEELMKFNPYHDRLGRFSTAGGATSFTYAPGKSKAHDLAIAREKERAAAASSAEAGQKRIADAESKLKSILRDGAEVNLKGVDPDLADSTVKNIEMVINRYPTTKDAYAGFTTDEPSPGYFSSEGKEGVMACYSTSTKMIHLNNKYYSNKEEFEKKYKNSVEKKHSPEGTTVDSVIVHEMGHAIDRYLSLQTMDAFKVNWGADSVSTRLWNNNIKNAKKKGEPLTGKSITDGLSRYATKNAEEYFAEGFSEYMTSSNPRPMAQKVGKHMEMYIKKAAKNK